MTLHKVMIRRKTLVVGGVDDVSETKDLPSKASAVAYVATRRAEIKKNYIITYHECHHDDKNNSPCVIKSKDVWEKD